MLKKLAREWTSPAVTAIETVFAEDGAEAIRRVLAAHRHDVACNLLLSRAIDMVTLRVRDLTL